MRTLDSLCKRLAETGKDAVVLRDSEGTRCERVDYSAAGVPAGGGSRSLSKHPPRQEHDGAEADEGDDPTDHRDEAHESDDHQADDRRLEGALRCRGPGPPP
jgi:hypothetical protein